MELASLLPLVGIALLFWLLIIRPQARRQKAVATMQAALQPGDEVMLTSGIYGTVRALDEEAVQLEVAGGVTIRVARAAIGSRVSSASAPAGRPGDTGDSGDTDQPAGER